MRDHRISPDLYTDILDVLHRHGFTRGDDQHAGRAILLIGDLASIYEGTLDYPRVPLSQAPAPPSPELHGPDSQDTVLLPASDRNTVLTALDIAADDMRDRAELCPDCPDQSCPSCRSRHRHARTYDQLYRHLDQAADPAAAHRGHTRPAAPARPAGHAAGKEAGQ